MKIVIALVIVNWTLKSGVIISSLVIMSLVVNGVLISRAKIMQVIVGMPASATKIIVRMLIDRRIVVNITFVVD